PRTLEQQRSAVRSWSMHGKLAEVAAVLWLGRRAEAASPHGWRCGKLLRALRAREHQYAVLDCRIVGTIEADDQVQRRVFDHVRNCDVEQRRRSAPWVLRGEVVVEHLLEALRRVA